MAFRKLRQFLDGHDVPYIMITHSPAYTAQGIAHVAHIPGGEMAKTVIVKVDDRLVMAVLPASRRVDLVALREAIGADQVEIATERDFLDTFPGCELGAMPPFGILWDIPVFISEELTNHAQIAFNAGSHTELVQMGYEDFERLVQPTVVEFGHVLA